MKLHALMIAVALASGSVFAAGSYDTQPAPQTRAGETMHQAGSEVRKAGSHAKHAVKKHEMRHASKHASAKHHGQKHAMAKHHASKHAAAKYHGQRMAARSDTRMMGAAPAPVTDLNAAARQRRIDEAYAHWRSLPR